MNWKKYINFEWSWFNELSHIDDIVSKFEVLRELLKKRN